MSNSPSEPRRRRRFWVELYGRTDPLARLLIKAVHAVYHGFWLGLLDGDALHELNVRFYSTSEALKSRDHNLTGLFPWERTALERYFGDCRSILVGGCGGGREVVALAQRGLRADGFDCCPPILAACQRLVDEEMVASQLLVSEPDHVPSAFGVYDGLIMGWGAWSHIAGRETRVRYLKEFRAHIAPGGPILLSFMTGMMTSRELRLIRGVGNAVRWLRRSPERVELGAYFSSGAYWRHFCKEDVAGELGAAGFQLEYFFEDLSFGHAVARAH